MILVLHVGFFVILSIVAMISVLSLLKLCTHREEIEESSIIKLGSSGRILW